jgi:hypothetical protein
MASLSLKAVYAKHCSDDRWYYLRTANVLTLG